jgi:alkanesulfonate monooxygenase SsuD/methylene tetrahydromethanopterin reductase-like flavin-dependent oxidoreductase (luciferase family)
MISVSVTDDVGAARAHGYSSKAFYDDLPAFRAVMNREGVLRAGELAVIGDEGSVHQQLRAYTDTGATEFILMPLDADAARLHRLWTLAATL